MNKSALSGYTLIELLVVIAIMAVIGVFALANFGSFGEDKKLDNALLDIQSQLRTAQTNATSNVQCAQFGAIWQVEFKTDAVTTNLNCQDPLSSPPPTIRKTSQLTTNIAIQSVYGDIAACPGGTTPTTPIPAFSIKFASISGTMDLGGTNCGWLILTLIDNKTGHTKALKIEKGGNIHIYVP